jgi:hypothetical protein
MMSLSRFRRRAETKEELLLSAVEKSMTWIHASPIISRSRSHTIRTWEKKSR